MRLTSFLLSLCCVSAAFAADQLPAEGYYRVKNYVTDRYIYVLDNHGYIDWGATSADLRAIELWRGLDKAVSDPATVLYLDQIDGRQYDVTAQGTGINQIIDYYVNLRAVSSKTDTYYVYATKSGMTKYLADGNRVTDNDFGLLTDNGEGEWRYWVTEKIATESDNYFGLLPDIDCNGTRYASFYASFPFSFHSSGLKALYVSHVDSQYGIAVVEETVGTFPGGTPLIVECPAAEPTSNRLNIGGTPTVSIDNNQLGGAYFDSDLYKHESYVVNDTATMRVPMALADGRLGFGVYDGKHMPRNKAYLKVPAGTPQSVVTMTPAEYEAWLEAHQVGIATVTADSTPGDTAIYNLVGMKVGDTRTGTSSLRPGLYITAGKKIIVK